MPKSLKILFFIEYLVASVVRRNTKHQEAKTRESKENKFEKKRKRNRVSCFNIDIVVFAFLSSTVEVGRR